jgi:prophage regulatory protein
MPKVALKSRLLTSTTRHEDPNPGEYVVDRNLAGNTSISNAPKENDVADHFPPHEAASYLIGLDDKPGAALLAASVRDLLVRIGDVCTISGLSVPTIYRLMTKGLFPRPVKITASARAWKLSELTTWVETRERGGSL